MVVVKLPTTVGLGEVAVFEKQNLNNIMKLISDIQLKLQGQAAILPSPLLPAGMGGLTVLSLFDGMSCGQLALQKAGIKVKQYYAAEIDKYAIQVTMANFPDTVQLGDVTKVFAKDLPKIDLLIGGSPCQGFSFAGKGLNFDDPRSKLFFEFVRLRKECNPKWFFLENVKMKYEHELVISKFMGVEPIEINSALLSAQNRQRLYWTNINEKPYGLFGELKPDIPQPKDKGMLLKHILETDVSDKYRLSEKAVTKILRRNWSKPQFEPLKTGAILPKNNSGQLSIDSGTTLIGCIKFGRTDEGKALRKESMAKGKDYTPFQAKQITGIDFEKMNTITAATTKDNLVMQLNPSTESNGCQPYQQNRIYDTEGIAPALMAQMSCKTHAILEKSPCLHGFEHGTNGQFNKQLANGGMVRRLTEVECERLQTVPDGYTNHVSSTQRYKMLGNGWTVDVIAYIFGFMKSELAKSAEW